MQNETANRRKSHQSVQLSSTFCILNANSSTFVPSASKRTIDKIDIFVFLFGCMCALAFNHIATTKSNRRLIATQRNITRFFLFFVSYEYFFALFNRSTHTFSTVEYQRENRMNRRRK